MNNIYNVIFVSNSIKYAEELKRTAQFNDVINVLGVARGIHDFKMRMTQAQNVHVVLIGDDLSDGSLMELLEYLQGFEDLIVFGIINHPESEGILSMYGIGAVYEKQMMPLDILSFLQESLTALSPEETNQRQKTYEKTPEEKVESFHSRFAEGHESSMEKNHQDTQSSSLNARAPSQPFDESLGNYQQPPTSSITQRKGVTTMGVLKPKVVCFTSAKGGVGKSAIAMEVASCLAARGNEVEINMSTRGASGEVNVVLVDLNYAFGTVAATLPCVSDMKNPPTLADWVLKIREKVVRGLSYEDKKELQTQEHPRYASFIYKMNRNYLRFTRQEVFSLLVKEPKTGMYILPTISSNFDVAEIENEFIEIIIEELSNFFDAVVLDTGNNFEGFTQTAFRMSNEIYIVANPNIAVTVIIKQLLKDAVDGLGIDRDKFRLVINHPQTNKQSIDDEAMQTQVGIPLAGGISHDENMLLSHDAGRFYAVNNKKKSVSKDITLIANMILPLWNVAGATKKGGLFQRFLGK